MKNVLVGVCRRIKVNLFVNEDTDDFNQIFKGIQPADRVKSVQLVGGCGFVDVDSVFDVEADDINQIFFVL